MNNYYVLDIDLRDPDGIAAEFDEALDQILYLMKQSFHIQLDKRGETCYIGMNW